MFYIRQGTAEYIEFEYGDKITHTSGTRAFCLLGTSMSFDLTAGRRSSFERVGKYQSGMSSSRPGCPCSWNPNIMASLKRRAPLCWRWPKTWNMRTCQILFPPDRMLMTLTWHFDCSLRLSIISSFRYYWPTCEHNLKISVCCCEFALY